MKELAENLNPFKMKKLFIAVPIIGTMLFNSSCTKEPETVTETITVTDTVNVVQNNSVGIYLKEFEQLDFGNSTYGMAIGDYTVQNVGEKKITSLKIVFEAQTMDGSKYTTTDYRSDIAVGDEISAQYYIDTADKKCQFVRVKSIEITTI